MTLFEGKANNTYIIKEIKGTEKVQNFLLTLGCYEDEDISIISKIADNVVVNVKNARYVLDEEILKNIIVYN
ncbi:iron transporter FeoA [Candidatus Epulonipiscium fishelsonii]|uniref:Iron transporter FeoA n=1 Tax=Candidatus Epulonipiscium fishelsonii TaxID=77094 RepID=A0ACC8XDL0_9FIRM|nr:iron transporter FeoA [Epulopiscium sp. SCG-D08WGA-EpuloA1]OON95093.1 MAG: iron transporter FeoA [Epulopiscium sp. AS2M-Bin002]